MNDQQVVTLESELSHFIGTEQYHRFNIFKPDLVLTDGMKYLCETAGCYWLADIVASVQSLARIKRDRRFILWSISKNADDSAVVNARTDCEPHGNWLYTQKIEYTDFPMDEFSFYQCGDVLLLKSEY